MKPAVSIVVPVHNAERFLVQCLDSVLAQTFEDYEVLCVDDASSDASSDILARYAARDGRFTVLEGTFGGPSATRNAALERARGDFIAFLDADDWWDPLLLEKTVSCAKRTEADIVVFDYWLYHQESGLFGTYRDQEFFRRMDGLVVNVSSCPELVGFVGIWDRLFRRSALVPHGFMDGLLYEDAVYCIESVLPARKVAIMADHLYYYRRNVTASITYTEDASRKHEEDFLVAQGYIRDCLERADVSREAWTCYARYFAEYAYMHQREVHPYGRFVGFFKEVRAIACPESGPQLFELWHDDPHQARNAYLVFVRENQPEAAWAEAKLLNVAGKVLRRR